MMVSFNNTTEETVVKKRAEKNVEKTIKQKHCQNEQNKKVL